MGPWFKAIVFPGFVFLAVAFLIIVYLERKIIADMHLRIGPYYVGKFGLLQTPADTMKLIQKELIVPKNAYKIAFSIAPILIFLTACLLIAFIPFSKHTFIISTNFDLLISLAIVTSISPLFFYAGWASKNKYSFMGSLRVVNQMVSGETPMWLSALAAAVAYRSLNFLDIVNRTSPLNFVILIPSFILFLIATLIVAERPPFDIPEAEEEIVYGFMTEFGGLNYFLMAAGKVIELFALFAMASTLFLGGFRGPILPGPVWLLIKMSFLYLLAFAIRSSTPRIRMDQLLKLCWAYLTPLSLINLVVIVIIKMLI